MTRLRSERGAALGRRGYGPVFFCGTCRPTPRIDNPLAPQGIGKAVNGSPA